MRRLAVASVFFIAFLAAWHWAAPRKATAQTATADEYAARIAARVRDRIIRTNCQTLANPEIQVTVVLLPDGSVRGDPEVRKSSGAAPCDRAVVRAIFAAQPLPVPADPALFQKVQNLTLIFR